MDLKRVKTNELIECYNIVLDYLKQLESKKKEVETSNEGNH